MRSPFSFDSADQNSRRAAIALGVALPTDVVLYLLLPMYASVFGVSLAETGMLLAANRLVRIVGYRWVASFYARRGDGPTCTLAVAAAICCAAGYATLSGFWWLLPLRLLWGMSFAALNLATQALATADGQGAARRYGNSRAFIALGPTLALPLGAAMSELTGPRSVFVVLALVAATGLLVTRHLPSTRHAVPAATQARRFSWPDSLSVWSFIEGFTLDGLFIIGLSFLARDMVPTGAVLAAGLLLGLRYLSEIVLSPVGGRMAERFGALRLLIVMSLATSVALVGFGAGWLLAGAAAIVVLRALQLPLIAPIVAARHPGAARVKALASRSVWRDIGAGTGPLVAGVVLPIASSLSIYSVAAALLALSAIACRARGGDGGGTSAE